MGRAYARTKVRPDVGTTSEKEVEVSTENALTLLGVLVMGTPLWIGLLWAIRKL